MARIHTLPPEEAHKIAAGEVVERPASVVKELLENALDAGADHINVIIQDGGRQRIRVIDNGHGMDQDDIRACIQEHTTSKITHCSELQQITSFGFRGEALASISNISKLTITSQEQHSHEGYTVTVDAGTITKEHITARSPGTDIIVDDIFYNVPARKKFLKKRETEWRAIYQLCVAIATSRPSCAIYITHDDRQVLQCPRAHSYMERIGHVHDRYFSRQFIECSYHDTQHGIDIQGAITHPEYHRYDRSMITCFINNRWIKNYRLSQAIIKGYADILPPRRFPAGYIFVTMPSEEIDINVHPRKEEVQFLHPRRIEKAIEQMVRTSLETHTRDKLTPHTPHPSSPSPAPQPAPSMPSSPVPSSSLTQPRVSHDEYPSYHALNPSQEKSKTSQQEASTLASATSIPPQEDTPRSAAVSYTSTSQQPQTHNGHDADDDTPQQQASIHYATETSEAEQAGYHILGQIHATYIIVENTEGFTLIDQHAAHERILYERFADTTQVTTTKLVFPHRIAMAQTDCEHIMAHAEHLASYGITIERFDTSNILVTAVPVALKSINWSDMLTHIMSILPAKWDEESQTQHKDIYYELCATMACKAAIKAGDQLSYAEMSELVQQLYTCEYRMTCPHGRPTIITFTHNELERKFKRSV